MNTLNDNYDGYVSDISYTNSYFSQLAPSYLNTTLLLAGFLPPKPKNGEPLRYLELGFGQGLSLNMHAAANQDIEFWGTDFLPEQAKHAQKFSDSATIGTHILNESFERLEKLAEENRLPKFDMIVLHGIWSWINDTNRNHILGIIHKLLKDGGLVYISYNTFPGRIDQVPLQKLLTLHARRKSQNENTFIKAESAAKFVAELVGAKANYFIENKYVNLINTLCKKDPTYLAHEYLNDNWDSFYFKNVAHQMKMIGCDYVVSDHFFQTLKDTQPLGTVPFIDEIEDNLDREALFDFNFFRGFRTDLFIKNPEKISLAELLKMKFIAVHNVDGKKLEAEFASTHIELTEEIYRPLLALLTENNYEPKSFEFLQAKCPQIGLNANNLPFYLRVLFHARYIYPYLNPTEKTLQVAKRLNRVLCEKTRAGDFQEFLLSPYLGVGYRVPELDQLFLLALANGAKNANDLAKYAQAAMQQKGKLVSVKTPSGIKKGKDAALHAALHFQKLSHFHRLLGLTL